MFMPHPFINIYLMVLLPLCFLQISINCCVTKRKIVNKYFSVLGRKLVVIVDNSCLRGCGFESRCCIMDELDIFHIHLLYCLFEKTENKQWAVVVARLTDQSLPTSEVRWFRMQSFANFDIEHFLTVNKTK